MNKSLLAQKIGQAICRPPVMQDTRGAVAVLVAIMLVVLLSFGALALDISNAMIARNELQNVADAAALAGARQLGWSYFTAVPSGTPYATYWKSNRGSLETLVRTAAAEVALENKARQVSIVINDKEIEIGEWDSVLRTLTVPPDPNPPFPLTGAATGVKVTAHRDDIANGAVATWLAGIMGIPSMNVKATATAALTGTGVLVAPDVPPPFGISSLFFTQDSCGKTINFSPTTTSCAAWHTYDQDPPNANKVRDILQGLTPPNTPSPPIPVLSVGDSLNYIGGELGSAAWPELVDLFTKIPKVDATATAIIIPNPLPPGWTGKCWMVKIPVYKESGDSCGNQNVAGKIVGFAESCVWDVVNKPPDRDIKAIVTCGEVTNGNGGGGNFGLLGRIPGLVE